MSKTTMSPLRNHQCPFRLQDDALETHRRWSTFRAGRDLKMDMQLPWCILGTSIMSKTNKTPLRNLHRPLKLLGGRSGELRCYTPSQDGRDLKVNTSLPWCILSIFFMSKTIKTLFRNHQCPLRLLERGSGEPRNYTTFQEGRNVKIY
jgi:hypothetical protein